MRPQGLLIVYMVNFSLLTAHEIDSAFWREWDLFGVPGGIQFFVLLHIPLLLLLMAGFQRLLAVRRSGYWISLLMAASGIGAFVVHGSFWLRGRSDFRLPASVLVLSALFAVSVVQLVATVKLLRTPPSSS